MAFVIDNKKIAKNTIALYVRLAFTMVIGFITTRVTLQQLGVEDFGLNNLVGSIVAMFSFLNGSMGTAVQRFYSVEIGKGNEDRLKRVFGTGLYLHIWVAIITVFFAEIFAIFFLHKMNIPEDRQFAAQVVFQISIVSLGLNIVNVPYAALLRAREMFDKTAILEIIQAVLRLGILYLLIIIDFDKLVVLAVLGLFVTLFYVCAICRLARKFDETHSCPLKDNELIKSMLSFISLLLVTILSQLAKTQSIVMFVNIFFGLIINAAYAVAVQVSNMVNTFAMSFKQSMIPQMMAACGAGDYKSMHKIINMGTKITFLLLMMISMPIMFEPELLLKIWLKTPPEHSAQLVSLVLIYINIASFTYFHYQGVHATGNIRYQQIFMSVLYIANIILIYVFFKLGASFETALYINMIVSFAQCVVNLVFAKRNFNYDIIYFCKSILCPCIIVAFIVVGVNLLLIHLLNPSIIRFILILTTSEFAIFICGYCIILNTEERLKIRSMFIRK